MALPTPVLDDRHFQDIVDEATSRIPRYCPEWTDHNVSDPGVALIELFAWMTDMLLYRVNQVPDKLYVKFLELIGVRLEPPRAARAPITFFLSAAQPTDIMIPEGTEVATVRTETNDAIVFTTESNLVVRTPDLLGSFTRRAAPKPAANGSTPAWTAHEVKKLANADPDAKAQIFSEPPVPDDALYFAFARDHSAHVMAVIFTCEIAGGAGVNPKDPPLVWEVWQGEPNHWVPCDIDYDGTGGFNTSGEVILHMPLMALGEFGGQKGFWLRCRVVAERKDQRKFYRSPKIERLIVEARGATIGARHATTVRDEVLGQSDGTAGQTFTLQHAPLLARDENHDYLIVEAPGKEPEIWTEVEDFAESGPEDRHFTLDNIDGTLTLGPTLIQADGSVYRFGAIPAKNSWLRFTRYQHGGGVAGDVPSNTLTVLKTSIPYVSQVDNREAALGGRNAQSLADARLRAPLMLRTRTRAVTAEDYEYLALQVQGVARAHCLAPGQFPSAPGDIPPGQVLVLVVPTLSESASPPTRDDLVLTSDLRASVQRHLDSLRVLGVALDVRAPVYEEVTVSVTLRVRQGSEQAILETVERSALAALYQYLSPYTGGPDGKGWPIGRDLHVSEMYARLQRLPYVEYVDDIQVSTIDPDKPGTPLVVSPRLAVTRETVLFSGRHKVEVIV